MELLSKDNPIETIESHTQNLLKNFDILNNLYPEIKYLDWEILKLACIYHDLGKISTKFQNKIIKKIKSNNKEYELKKYDIKDTIEDLYSGELEIPHNYLSPAFLPYKKLFQKWDKEKIRILVRVIFKHHKKTNYNFKKINFFLKNDIEKNFQFLKFKKIKEIDLSEGIQEFERYAKKIEKDNLNPEMFYKYILILGLLKKIDYASSSCVKINTNGKISTLEVEKPNKDLIEKVSGMLSNLSAEGKNSLQKYLENNKDENNVIVASTGMGKTEAGLLWIGNNKGFFSLPLKVSADSIYKRIKEKKSIENSNYIGFEEVGLLHSDTLTNYREEFLINNRDGAELIEYTNLTRQLSLPLTVCTLDQLIDFVYLYEGFELKLAILSYSKLIIDEIQMYSSKYLGTILTALKYITDVSGKFTIMTATLPPIIEYYLKEKLKIDYRKPGNPFLKNLIRHKMKIFEENINTDRIIENYKDKRVLVICNTVKKAQEIYMNLKEKLPEYEVFLLHSRFIKKDRKNLEDKLKYSGNRKNNVKNQIWVSTQIVECSLDLDFDILYTELSGLIQRMGRVYRNRELNSEIMYNVYVFTGTDRSFPSGIKYENKKSVADFDLFNESKKTLLNYKNEIITEDEKIKWVENTYTYEKLKCTRFHKEVKKQINYLQNLRAFDADKFRIDIREIETVNILPKVIYDENRKEIDNLKAKINRADLSDIDKFKYIEMLRKFYVPVYPSMKKKIVDKMKINKKFKEYDVDIVDIDYTCEIGINI